MKSSRFLVPAFAFAFVAMAANAQGTLTGSAPKAADPGLTGKAALGYLSTSGNTQSTNANASLSLVYQLEVWQHHFDASAIMASNSDVTTAEAYKAKYEAQRNLGEHGYAFTALDWNHDRFSGYDRQTSVTAGYGRRFIESARQSLDGSIGVGARESVLLGGQTLHDTIGRLSVEYLYKLSESSEFDQSVVVESGSENTTTESVTSLKAKLVGDLSLVLSFRIKHNSEVPPGVEQSDRFTSIALEYSF